MSIYFKPTFRLAHELVHEDAHHKFWRNHDMLDRDWNTMVRFEDENGLENEKYALAEETRFLRKIRYVVPDRVKVKLFRIRHWVPEKFEYEAMVSLARMQTRKGINSNIKVNEKEMREMSSKRYWDERSTDQDTKKHLALSSILMLPLDREEWPVVEMEI